MALYAKTTLHTSPPKPKLRIAKSKKNNRHGKLSCDHGDCLVASDELPDEGKTKLYKKTAGERVDMTYTLVEK